MIDTLWNSVFVLFFEVRKFLERLLSRCMRINCEYYWREKCGQMKKSLAVDNNHSLYRLLGISGPRKPSASEVIKELTETLVHL